MCNLVMINTCLKLWDKNSLKEFIKKLAKTQPEPSFNNHFGKDGPICFVLFLKVKLLTF